MINVITATVSGRNATVVMSDGAEETVNAELGHDIRALVLRRATAAARRLGDVIELRTLGDKGEHILRITPGGTVTPRSPRPSTDAGPATVPPAPAPSILRPPASPRPARLTAQDAVPATEDITYIDVDVDEWTTVSQRRQTNTLTGPPRWQLVFPSATVEVTQVCVIGRNPAPRRGEHVITVPDPTQTLSRRHARLEPVADGVLITDLDAKNGIAHLVDDILTDLPPQTPTLIRPGERLLLGDLDATLHAPHPANTPTEKDHRP